MAHITSIGAGLFSDLSFSQAEDGASGAAACLANPIAATFAGAFATMQAITANAVTIGLYKRIQNIREFPQMGVPPNIVNVPKYGSKTSAQVQGQADSPTFEVVLNYVPDDWTAAGLGQNLTAGKQHVFRFALLNTLPTTNYNSTAATGIGNAGATLNSLYYWVGKLEALQINPQLTDANQATLTISIQSDFYGAFTAA